MQPTGIPMTSRDRVIRTLNHQPVDRAPRDLWLVEGMETQCADALTELNLRFPSDIVVIDGRHGRSKPYKPSAGGVAVPYLDPWGCGWQTGPYGEPGRLQQSPLTDAIKMAGYVPPAEMLEAGRFAVASGSCQCSNRFALAWSDVKPLGRMQALCGPEVALAEISEGHREARRLLARLHEHFRRETELWAGSQVDAVAIHDDLGTAPGLRLTSKLWRQILKPLYRDYCEILRSQDKFVFFYSEGRISDLYADLIEVGFDAIYAPVPLLDLERLAEDYRGRVTFWIDLGWQRMAASGSREDICEEVRRVRQLLDFGSGIIARCPWGTGMPLRNVIGYFEEWMTAMPAGA